jgi:hypothetical protein
MKFRSKFKSHQRIWDQIKNCVKYRTKLKWHKRTREDCLACVRDKCVRRSLCRGRCVRQHLRPSLSSNGDLFWCGRNHLVELFLLGWRMSTIKSWQPFLSSLFYLSSIFMHKLKNKKSSGGPQCFMSMCYVYTLDFTH